MQNDHIEHFGIIGMKWGTRRGQKKIDKMEKKVDRAQRRYDWGSPFVSARTFGKLSKKTRTLTRQNHNRTRRMEKYLKRIDKEASGKAWVKFNRDPEKAKKAKAFIEQQIPQKKKLSEIRSSLIDIKMELGFDNMNKSLINLNVL